MIAAHAITSALTRATSTSFLGFRPDDLVVGDFGLAQFIAEAPVSFITNYRFLPKFRADGRIDFQVLPFVLQDLFEVWQVLVVLYNERDSF